MLYATHRFSIEHIIPVIVGGATEIDNLALACQGCNNAKYDHTTAIDPVSQETVALYHPRRDQWAAHVAWSVDALALVGLIPSGRATIAALDLNRQGVVNLRRLLRAYGEHSPPIQPDDPVS